MDESDLLDLCDCCNDEPTRSRWWQVLLFFWVLS